MFARSMTAAAALLAFAACSAPRATTPSAVNSLHESTGPVRVTEKLLKDDEGNTVMIRLDGSELAKTQPVVVTDKTGKQLPIHDYALKDVALCKPDPGSASNAPRAEAPTHPCQRASSVTDGAFIKFGAASCTCTIVFQKLKCYGTSCPP